MDSNLVVTKIHTVFEGGLKEGFLGKKKIGRHSDGFVYFVSGEAEYTFDNYSFIANPNCFFYLAKDSIYSIKVFERVSFICIDFDFYDNNHHRLSSVFNNVAPSIKSDFTKLFYVWNKGNLWHNAQSLSILYKIYSEGLKSENKEYAKQNAIFSEATSFIFENYTEPSLSVEKIAKHLDISKVHLRRIFKIAANISPVKYINFLRLEKAKNLLHSSNLTIAEIAESVGFEDPFYFSKLFKKEIGVSPLHYRNLYDKSK